MDPLGRNPGLGALLNDAVRADAVMPRLTLDKDRNCLPGIPCRQFQGATLTILVGDRTVVYRLIHNLAVDGEAAVSDAVGGGWPA
jgi:hypothetical protein